MGFMFFKKDKNDKDNTKSSKQKVEAGLHKTKETIGNKILNIFAKQKISNQFFDEIEEALIMADVGVEMTMKIIDGMKERSKKKKIENESDVREIFKDTLSEIIIEQPFEFKDGALNVIFVFGVNGVGKTTSIAKLTNMLKEQGKKVMVAACDTFRAAAIEQLQEWCERIDVPIIKHSQNSDPGAVLYDALESSSAKKMDFLIVDTAGRLHNKENLMKEIEKLNKILEKKTDKTNKQNFLVLDAGTGQNAFIQAQSFKSLIEIDGIILTKLDSTAKGGILISLTSQLGVPVKFIGVGESLEDLLKFNRSDYVDSLI